MDKKLIEELLASKTSKNKVYQEMKEKRLKYFWKPTAEGKYNIRILKNKFNSESPFTELKFYQNIAKFPMLDLNQFGEKDPIYELKESLKSNWVQNKDLILKLTSKPRYYVNIIVRGTDGNPDKGPLIWDISKTMMDSILTSVQDMEVYETFEDDQKGIDWVVTVKESDKKYKGKSYFEYKLTAKSKSSPTSTDKTLMKSYIDNQLDIMDFFTKPSFDVLKNNLSNLINTNLENSEDVGTVKKEASTEQKDFKALFKKVNNPVEVEEPVIDEVNEEDPF